MGMGRLKTVRFYTLGCKVNQYETQAIREQFQQASFEEIQNSQPAGVCVINTCTVTHRADSSSFYLIRRAVCENPDAQIIVTGCLTQFDSDRIARIPGVSLIVKNEDKNRIISLLDNQLATCYSLLVPPLHAGAGLATQSGITYFKNHSRAFLKIQDGCDYRCSYCKVRLVRGKSRSRTSSEIKEELAALVKKDYREIVLCGICLGSYGKDLIPQLSLTKLIGELETIDAAFRIRLSSIEAKDVTDELIHIMSDSDRLCRHLHIPVQSGDERILKMMNRQYSRDDYIKLIKHLKDCMMLPESFYKHYLLKTKFILLRMING